MPKKRKITYCVLCGTPIEYATKKPLRCQHCKDIKLSTRSTAPKTKWKKETAMFSIMSELLPGVEYIVNGYYSWLISPKGKPMQLDWYSPEINLAVELNGQQHYQYTKYFHKTKREFEYLQQCDKIKETVCKARGITLLPVPYNSKVTHKMIIDILKEKNEELYNRLVRNGILKLPNNK